MLADDFHLVVVRLGPAHIHAHQHLRPILALGAAGACVDLDKSIVAVGLAGQQRLDLAGMGLLPELGERGLGLGDDARIALFLAERDEGDIVVKIAGDAVEGGERGLDVLTLAHQALRATRVVPEIRCLSLAVERP